MKTGTFSQDAKLDELPSKSPVAAYAAYTPICNITGQPGMSVPLYWNADVLPIGSHFIARYGDEATLFRLAAQLEQARPWANRWPPVSVAAVV